MDDNETCRTIFVESLSGWRANPVAVTSGPEALAIELADIFVELFAAQPATQTIDDC